MLIFNREALVHTPDHVALNVKTLKYVMVNGTVGNLREYEVPAPIVDKVAVPSPIESAYTETVAFACRNVSKDGIWVAIMLFAIGNWFMSLPAATLLVSVMTISVILENEFWPRPI